MGDINWTTLDRAKAMVQSKRQAGYTMPASFAEEIAAAIDSEVEQRTAELRRWITLYSDCDCDTRKYPGRPHWFACRAALATRILYPNEGEQGQQGVYDQLLMLVVPQHLWMSSGARVGGHEDCETCAWLEANTKFGEAKRRG